MEIRQLLDKVAQKTMEQRYNDSDMNYYIWDWQEGVGMYGLIKAYQATGDKRYLNFVKEWVDYHLDKGLPEKSVNTTIHFVSVLELYKETGEQRYRWLCEEMAKFCMCKAKRANEGALEHTVLDIRFESQIWADTLFMGAIFLARWGSFTGDDMYINEAVRQILLHYKYLLDPQTGLIFHGYNCMLGNHMSAVRWGRANGWAVLSCVEILDMIPDYFEEKGTILKLLNDHADSMLKYCNENGMWHTVLDCPDTYEETTVGAALCGALHRAVRSGYLPDRYMEQNQLILRGLTGNIAEDGKVLNASGGTAVKKSIEEYNKVPCVMSYYGQGLALMSLSAMQEGRR